MISGYRSLGRSAAIPLMRRAAIALAAVALAGLVACSGGDERRTLWVSGVPDQDASLLEARFTALAAYLAEETGLDVRYVPHESYAAVVDAFREGDVHLAWYGGLTGVQARLAVLEAEAIAQRPRDAAFHSVFVAAPDSGIADLAGLRGRTLTFGSESSNSGHLMPRFFLREAGIDVERDLAAIGFSGSHDRTWRLVADGAFDAGALNAVVWEARVAAGEVDRAEVDVFFRTPPYVNYHWVVNRAVDASHGAGTVDQLRDALLAIDAARGGRAQAIADAFQTDRFIPTADENYRPIEEVARELGIIGP